MPSSEQLSSDGVYTPYHHWFMQFHSSMPSKRLNVILRAAIVPPPTDVKSAAERGIQYKSFDWWFCHKPL